MQKYKDLKGNVHCLDDTSFEHLLPAGCVRITEEEAVILSAPKPTIEDRAVVIRARLEQIDLVDTPRPLRAVVTGTATQYDHDKLFALESEATTLREELRELLK